MELHPPPAVNELLMEACDYQLQAPHIILMRTKMTMGQSDGVCPPLAGMGTLNAMTAQDWISAHLQPTDPQMQHLFEHVYPELDQALNIC